MAVCTLDLYDGWGDGWNGGVMDISLPDPQSFSMPCPSDIFCNDQYKGPVRFIFVVDFASPSAPPPSPPQPPHGPPPPQGPGLEYPLGNVIPGSGNDHSGQWGLALNSVGNVLAVNTNNARGVARVYDYSNSNSDWVQRGLDILGETTSESSSGASDHAGNSIALNADGTIVAIGGHTSHGGAYFGREGSAWIGVVRVHRWNSASNAWEQIGQDIDGERSYDQFGIALDLSSDGTVLAVGGPYNRGHNNQNPGQGFARVFKWEPNTIPNQWYDVSVGSWVGGNQPGAWVQMGQDIDGKRAVDGDHGNQGLSVALSADGNVVVVGVPWADSWGPLDPISNPSNPPTNGGLARVYEWDPNTTPDPWHSHEAQGMVGGDQPGAWVQRGGDLDTGNHVDANGYDFCGWSVGCNHDGSIVAIGCQQYHDSGRAWNSGRVRAHEWNGTAYVPRGSPLLGYGGDFFGYSLGMSDDGLTILVGAARRDGINGNGAHRTGAMIRYQWHGGDWEKRGEAAGSTANEEIGERVALSGGGTVMVMAHSHKGNAYVFGTPLYYPPSPPPPPPRPRQPQIPTHGRKSTGGAFCWLCWGYCVCWVCATRDAKNRRQS